MESKTFGTNSLVYRFLAWPYGSIPRRNIPDDICDLRRAVIGKVFLGLALILMVATYAGTLTLFGLHTLAKYFPFFSAYAAENFLVHLGGALFILTAILGGVLGLGWLLSTAYVRIGYYLHKRRQSREEAGLKPLLDPVTSPVREMYRSWKDKLCYRVEFK